MRLRRTRLPLQVLTGPMLLLFAAALLATGCGEESPAAPEPDAPGVQAATVDLSGVNVEMHQEPG